MTNSDINKADNQITTAKTPSRKKQNKKKALVFGGALLGLIPIIFVVYIVFVPTIAVMKTEMNTTKMRVIAKEVNIRSDKTEKSYVIGKVKYGEPLKVYETLDNWVKIYSNEMKGYIKSDYVVPEITFHEIEGICGDNEIKKYIKQTKYKTAIARYLNEKGYTSKIANELHEELYGSESDIEIYQLFYISKGSFKSICITDLDGDKEPDASFVLKNINTDELKLVILSFDKLNPINKSKILFEMDMVEPHFYIKKAPKENSYNMEDNEKKRKLKIDGLLIGSNRNKSFKDPVNLLIYDGNNFVLHKQKQNQE